MLKALLAVDGSPNSERAVRHFIELNRQGMPLRAVVVNVQREIDAIEVRSHVPAAELVEWQTTRGREALEPATVLLDEAGAEYTTRIELGDPGPTIARVAADEQCDLAILGTRGMGSVGNLVLGSVATKVIHLVKVPVTLVK